MARPTKCGLDYFPLDVGFFRDKKVRLLRAEFGASSVLFVLYVFCRAYEEDGYFLRWDRDELLLAADELKESPAFISEVLQGCLSRSLFDEGVFQMFGVLTSAGIQRRYLRGCEKRADIQLAKEYFLLDVNSENDVSKGILAKLTFFEVSGGKNPGFFPRKPQFLPPETPKVKESKVKESKYPPVSPQRGEPVQEDAELLNAFQGKLREAVEDWLRYKTEKRQGYKPTGLKSLITEIRANADRYGEAEVAALIRQCMASNWQGIMFDRLAKERGAGANGTGRQYRKGAAAPELYRQKPEDVKSSIEYMKRMHEKLTGGKE